METLYEMRQRINRFSIHSLYCKEDGSFETHPNSIDKVDGQGNLKGFYGNSMIFNINDPAFLEMCKKCCTEINRSIMMAQPLLHHTMHMTLHDLINGSNQEVIYERQKEVGKLAYAILNDLPDFQLKMKPVRIYSMNQTSIVLGMEAIDEENHQLLMMLYERFQMIHPLSYPLTPHITLGYYRPGIYPNHDVLELERQLYYANEQIKEEVLVFNKKHLKLMNFTNMNDYQAVVE